MKSIVLAIVLIAILVTGNALPALAADSTAPQIFLPETVTPSSVVTLTGTAPAGSLIEIFRNNRSLGITVANDQGSFSLVTYIDEGINAFQARLVGSDGSSGARHHRSVLSGFAGRLLGAGSHRHSGGWRLDERLFGRFLPS